MIRPSLSLSILLCLSSLSAFARPTGRSFSPYTEANHVRTYDGVEIPHVGANTSLAIVLGIADFDPPGVGLQPTPLEGCEVQGATSPSPPR